MREFRTLFKRYPDRLLYLDQVVIPTELVNVIPYLAPPKPGFYYQSSPRDCTYICYDLQTIQEHYADQYLWVRPRQRGQPRKTEGGLYQGYPSLLNTTVAT